MAPFDSNWQAAMAGHTDYQQVIDPPTGGGGPGASGGGGTTGGTKGADEPTAPKGYKPSTVDQRKNWNQFLDYLDKKGVGGSKNLDARDQSLGKKYLAEYNKANPDQAVDESFVPTAQYESYLIRKKGQFPGLSDKQNQYAFSGLAPNYKNRQISAVDSWLGSATSKQYYPNYIRASAKGNQDFGTSFEDYLKGVDLGDSKSAPTQSK